MVVPRVCRRAVCGAICGEVPVVVIDESRCCRGGIAQIPSDSYANAVSGCFHAGEGAGLACMDDLVVDRFRAL